MSRHVHAINNLKLDLARMKANREAILTGGNYTGRSVNGVAGDRDIQSAVRNIDGHIHNIKARIATLKAIHLRDT